MIPRILTATAILLLAVPAFASALGTAARSVIPSDVQQIITVDYRKMSNSPTALALKARIMPQNLKEFERALMGAGIKPEHVEQLAFASFRVPQSGLRVVGIAQGQFPGRQILAKLRKNKVRPTKYRESKLYPMAGGMQMTFLDQWTLLFGTSQAVRVALDARDGEVRSLNSNTQITDLMAAVGDSAVWSVLDAAGTQTMMRSALGEAASLTDYDFIKKRLVGSRYVMDFDSGVDFNLDVFTSDSLTAATLSSLLQAGVMYKRMSATGVEKTALDNVSVDSDSSRLKVRFEVDDNRFQSLLNSDLFAAVSR